MGQICIYIEAIQITRSSGIYQTNIYHNDCYVDVLAGCPVQYGKYFWSFSYFAPYNYFTSYGRVK